MQEGQHGTDFLPSNANKSEREEEDVGDEDGSEMSDNRIHEEVEEAENANGSMIVPTEVASSTEESANGSSEASAEVTSTSGMMQQVYTQPLVPVTSSGNCSSTISTNFMIPFYSVYNARVFYPI